MRRTLEALFRHPMQLLILILLLPVIGLGVAYFLPRTYQATATLWALQRYAVIGATGAESDLQATPADTQATALGELLQTRAFALTIAKQTDLPATFDQSDPQVLNDDLYNEVQNVKVAGQGYNLFQIDYTNKDPKIAKQIVAAVIKTYGEQILGFSTFEAQVLLESYQTQLVKAKKDLSTAVNAESAYLTNHPGLKPTDLAADPQYNALHNQTLQSQTTLQSIQGRIDTVNQEISDQGTGSGSLYKVQDPPSEAKPVSRSRLYLTGGGIGIGIALLACVLYLVLMVRRDRSIYTALDLQKVTTFPVLMQTPRFAQATVLQLQDHTL